MIDGGKWASKWHLSYEISKHGPAGLVTSVPGISELGSDQIIFGAFSLLLKAEGIICQCFLL